MNITQLRTTLAPWFRGAFRPATVAPWEAMIMRTLFACVVWQTFPENFHFAAQKFPNGIARWFDLTWLGATEPVHAMLWMRTIVALCLAVYAAGFLLPLVLPVLTVASILVRTYYNSQGSIHHGCQMITLVLLFQTFVALWFGIRRLRSRAPVPFPDGLNFWSYFVFYSQGAIAGSYVIAALTKIVRTSGEWFYNSPYMALEVIKTERQEFYSTLDASVKGTHQVYAEWMLAWPNLARIALGGGVVLELIAIVALFNRQAALVIGVGMLLFHESVAITMALYFRFNEYAVWIFLINIPFWTALAMQRAKGTILKVETGSAMLRQAMPEKPDTPNR